MKNRNQANKVSKLEGGRKEDAKYARRLRGDERK